MKLREIKTEAVGHRATDGAGVNLIRVLSNLTARAFDPFLMLDSFDSANPDDYTRGFPMHPHRGVETITYLIEGEITHKDSLGNMGVIHSGEAQWMTAGSGIMHEEMPHAAQRMLGVQVWLNLPADDKMVHPSYMDISKDMIPAVAADFGTIRVISGEYDGRRGITPQYVSASMFDITVDAGKESIIKTRPEDNAFVFLIEGDGQVGGATINEKTAVLFGEGEAISISAMESTPLRYLYFGGEQLRQPVMWGGPIVMNTREQLDEAFAELDSGNFIKHNAVE